MPNHLSVLGIIHTAISIIALFFGFYASFRFGKITPLKGAGKWYTITTILTCITGLPIMKTGHFTGAHGLAIMILILIPIAIYAKSVKLFGPITKYVETVVMSGTLFFSMIPAVVETLTRLPISSPIAKSPDSDIIKSCLVILIVGFVTSVTFQVRKITDAGEAIEAVK
ncbi:hypothetical protein [Mucilaginibacter pedocola]|uniref:DUF2306 domain-containing protein n=1 Tax=Mucilaginibacter pedocola TaxID=1792845 RepID=A0A1S9P831_9SPHI|nr:hypothetical protein [Mucilaginibacter pedocola]OOQ57106.1 hypothetical protein BC343_16395 [Mucilaginibacter pedocola]